MSSRPLRDHSDMPTIYMTKPRLIFNFKKEGGIGSGKKQNTKPCCSINATISSVTMHNKAIVAYLILCSESRRLSVVNAYHDVEDEVSQRKQAGVGGPKSLFRVGKLTEVFFDIAASLTQDFKSQY